jgi:ribosomal protein L35
MKLKTRKSALKRVKIRKNSLFFKKSFKGHLLRKKNAKRIRRLSLISEISNSDISKFYKMIPYI